MKSDVDLRKAGFTQSGATRYAATAEDYCEQLFKKSVALGDLDKAPDTEREVTHEHVRGAAAALSLRNQQTQTPLQIWCQIGEYFFTALAGVGGGNLTKTWGIVTFCLSLVLGMALFVTRNTRSRPV